MEKLAKIAVLLDIYGELLTPRQRDVMDLYFNFDLSLAEIAEQYGISRQGVHDLIKRGEQTLEGAEQKIGAVKRLLAMEDVLVDIVKNMDEMLKKWDGQVLQKPPEDVKSEIGEWKDRLAKLVNIRTV